ncbi:MAG: HNH/ENDO VII family nuclease [Pseudomonas sp.]|uniref:HNH/ENDO VII family nuclease n=1 Tax=Pseudomonas sp. TaxID=306 RepID=UPI001A50B9EE|nr:HNH/ENDO VII family nuclease [Pseudomonas sp.]MBL7230945.1 HNH/ENDO VII family nuclease [Pseudomonas sp.]
MNFENFSGQKSEVPSPLALLAREVPSLCLVVAELDRPIVLTQETRLQLPEMSPETRERLELLGVPKDVLDAIGSEAEAKIYEGANLEPAEVNGKDALIRTDIDYDQKDAMGTTNLDRMKSGRAPLDANGKPIELHHIGQKQDSPLAELTSAEHRGNGNDNVLHNKQKESEINREDFDKERKDYWKARAEQIENQR